VRACVCVRSRIRVYVRQYIARASNQNFQYQLAHFSVAVYGDLMIWEISSPSTNINGLLGRKYPTVLVSLSGAGFPG